MTDAAKTPAAVAKAEPKTDKPAKKSYKVRSPLMHDNKDYRPGDMVPLTDEQAIALSGFGVIELPTPTPKPEA
jgi:hypothetical protein